jgi:hypothetical protein
MAGASSFIPLPKAPNCSGVMPCGVGVTVGVLVFVGVGVVPAVCVGVEVIV